MCALVSAGARHPPAGPSPPPRLGPAHGPRPLPPQAARSLGRWLWPTLAVSGFVAVVARTFDHDPSAPGLSSRGLLTVALAAVVVVLLTIHRRNGPRPLARAMAEYTVVVVLAGLLAAAGTGSTSSRTTTPPAAKLGPRPPPATTSPP